LQVNYGEHTGQLRWYGVHVVLYEVNQGLIATNSSYRNRITYDANTVDELSIEQQRAPIERVRHRKLAN
jgi:hypothetical protein